MRPILLLASLLLLGCPFDGGGGAGGGGGTGDGRVAGRLTIFQGAKFAPKTPTLASMLPKKRHPLASYTSDRLAIEKLLTFKSIAAKPVAHVSSGPEWIAGEVIVRMHEKLTARNVLAQLRMRGFVTKHGGFASEYLHLLKRTRLDGSTLSVGETHELAAQLEAMPGVRFTEVNQWQHAFAVPNDKLYSAQWHYASMNLPAAWDITQGSSAIVVADIDTGIVPHPDLDSRIISGIDMIADPANAGDGDGRDDNPLDMGGDLPNGGSS